MKDNIEAAKQRVELVKKLNQLKPAFRKDPNNHYEEYTMAAVNLYQAFSGLRFYLLLTCFDILGQERDFYQFGEWLSRSETAGERDILISTANQRSLLDNIKHIHNGYQSLYSVRRSFNRFIDKMSKKNRDKLYASIKIEKQVVAVQEDRHTHIRQDKPLPDEIRNRLGSWTQDWKPTEGQKRDFLFKIRNDFTHAGVAMADGFYAIFNKPHMELDYEAPRPIFKSNWDGKTPPEYEYRWMNIYCDENPTKCENPTFRKVYSVKRWPMVLIEIIEETISELQLENNI